MTRAPVDVPGLVRQRASRLGVAGAAWLTSLPELVADLQREWSITVGEALPGGSASYVARARTADGEPVVLKLAIPRPDLGAQVRTLADADGRGYVRLLAHDLGRHALLLEHLGPSLERLDRPPEQQLDALVATLQHAWQVPPPPGLLAEPGADKARSLAELVSTLWEQLGRPWPERVVELALTYADRRAGYPLDRSVFVHGDPHPGNALQAVAARPGAESGFCFVDPNGFMADPAYDLGVALRDWGPQLLAGDPLVARAAAERWCQRLAAGSGLDPTRIWEWGFLERVSSGLYVLDLGAVEMSRRFLRTAELLA